MLLWYVCFMGKKVFPRCDSKERNYHRTSQVIYIDFNQGEAFIQCEHFEIASTCNIEHSIEA